MDVFLVFTPTPWKFQLSFILSLKKLAFWDHLLLGISKWPSVGELWMFSGTTQFSKANFNKQSSTFFHNTCYRCSNRKVTSDSNSLWFILYDKFITIICIFHSGWLGHQVVLLTKQGKTRLCVNDKLNYWNKKKLNLYSMGAKVSIIEGFCVKGVEKSQKNTPNLPSFSMHCGFCVAPY